MVLETVGLHGNSREIAGDEIDLKQNEIDWKHLHRCVMRSREPNAAESDGLLTFTKRRKPWMMYPQSRVRVTCSFVSSATS